MEHSRALNFCSCSHSSKYSLLFSYNRRISYKSVEILVILYEIEHRNSFQFYIFNTLSKSGNFCCNKWVFCRRKICIKTFNNLTVYSFTLVIDIVMSFSSTKRILKFHVFRLNHQHCAGCNRQVTL